MGIYGLNFALQKNIHSDPKEGFKKFKSQIVEGETKTGIPGV